MNPAKQKRNSEDDQILFGSVVHYADATRKEEEAESDLKGSVL